MPRMARVVLPQMPHHVAQRGHNRQAVFAEEGGGRERYLQDLRELSAALEVRVYASQQSICPRFCLWSAPNRPEGWPPTFPSARGLASFAAACLCPM